MLIDRAHIKTVILKSIQAIEDLVISLYPLTKTFRKDARKHVFQPFLLFNAEIPRLINWSLKSAKMRQTYLLISLTFVAFFSISCTSHPQIEASPQYTPRPAPLSPADILTTGRILNPKGAAIFPAMVSLTIYNSLGESIFEVAHEVDSVGGYSFNHDDIPSVILTESYYVGIITAKANRYYNATQDVVLVRDTTGRFQSVPVYVAIESEPYNPWLILIILVPAVLGVILAVLHFFELFGEIRERFFAVTVAIIWGIVVSILACLYAKEGYATIPVFSNDFALPTGVLIFSFVGSVVYIAYSVYQREEGFFTKKEEEVKRRLTRVLGGRLLIAPYIALAAYGVLAATFPALRSGPFAVFFGFFTGIWIKVVIEMLNDVGKRFLSVETRQALLDRMTHQSLGTSTPAIVSHSIARSAGPNPGLLKAVVEARKVLLKLDGVIGVSHGYKKSIGVGNTNEEALIVYVYKKMRIPDDDPALVPSVFQGFKTDVQALPPVVAHETCRSVVFDVSWEKIHNDNKARLLEMSLSAPRTNILRGENNSLLILEDSKEDLFLGAHKLFDIRTAYEAVWKELGDHYEFVAFVIHADSGLAHQCHYYVPLFNDIQGVNFFGHGNLFSRRDKWNNSLRLRGCQVYTSRPNRKTWLHEIGHAWCAYVTYNTATETDKPNLLMGNSGQGRLHWNRDRIKDRSCMGYNRFEYVEDEKNSGWYKKRRIKQEEFVYSSLDLYLMGLLPKEQVEPIRIFHNPQKNETTKLYQPGSIETVSADQIIASCNLRSPLAQAPQSFRQAVVVVTKNLSSGVPFAHNLESDLKAHELAFQEATTYPQNHGIPLATLNTSLVEPLQA